MAYRPDSDLEFLGKMQSEDLDQLVNILIYDKDGEKRYTEELSGSENYKRYRPDHVKYWQEIAGELQKFGGNTIANFFRSGKGVPYKEILTDVCDKLKVNYNKNSSTETIERNLIMKIMEEALEKMSDGEREKLARDMGLKNTQGFSAQFMTGAFQAIFRAGGIKSYQYTLIIANAILKALTGRGLSFVGNTILTRVSSIIAGPIGWAVTGIWAAYDIAGPAYRVTIPAVIEVTALRQKYLYGDLIENEDV